MNSKSFYSIFTSVLCLLVLSIFTPKTARAQQAFSCELLMSEPSITPHDFPVYAHIEQIRHSTVTKNIFALLQLYSEAREWGASLVKRIALDLSTAKFKDISFSQIIYENILLEKADDRAEEMHTEGANHFAAYSQYKATLGFIYQEVELYRNSHKMNLPFEVRLDRAETLLMSNEKFRTLYTNDRGAAVNLVRDILNTRSQSVSDMVDKVAGKLPRPKHLSEMRQYEFKNYSNIENLRKSILPPQLKRGTLDRALKSLPETKDLSADERSRIMDDLFEADYAEVSAGQLINENLIVAQAIALKIQRVQRAFSESSVISATNRIISKTEYDLKLVEVYNAIDAYRKNENHAFARALVIDRITQLVIADLRFSVGQRVLDEDALFTFLKNLFDPKNIASSAQEIANHQFQNGHD